MEENKIRAILIDDENLNNDFLADLIREYCPTVDVVHMATTVDAGLAAIIKYEPDLVFLDIEINGDSGFDILSAIKNRDVYVIIVSAYEKYALMAIRHNAVDYILKPIRITDLVGSIDRYYAMQERKTLRVSEPSTQVRMLKVSNRDHVIFINCFDIIYIEVVNVIAVIHTRDKQKILSSKGLRETLEDLPQDVFVRTHNSYAVNKLEVYKYLKSKNGSLLMSDGTQIPISETRRKFVFEALNL
ncbi:MAG: response regulator transcription factor [Chitinophagaceae bacterium]|nr:response regulator transcription factor [Chitinophagaceae bacterium]